MTKNEIYYFDIDNIENLDIEIVYLVSLDSNYFIFSHEDNENYYFHNYSIKEDINNPITFKKEKLDKNNKYFKKIKYNELDYIKYLLNNNEDTLLKVLRKLNG
ncbi:MAG: hypothetical protein ACOCP4_07575 [Candidatus Woesearchaeota archaeon]